MSGRPPLLTVDTSSRREPVASTSFSTTRTSQRCNKPEPPILPRSSSLGSRSSRARSRLPINDDLLHPLRGAANRLGLVADASTSSSSLASAGTTGAGSGYGTDSAYGTLDEYDDSQGEEADESCRLSASWVARQAPGWRDRVEQSFQTRSRRRVQAVLDAEGWSRRSGSVAQVRWRTSSGASLVEDDMTAPPSPEPATAFHPFPYGGDSAFASSESLASSSPTTPSTLSSRSSPEPSEYGGDSESAALQISLAYKRRRLLLGDSPPKAQLLARRHTLPRRKVSREILSPAEADCLLLSPSLSTTSSVPPSPSPPQRPLVSRARVSTPLAICAAWTTLAVSSISALSPFTFVTPVSPVHLRHADSALTLSIELGNAVLAPFLATPALPGAALAAANLYLLLSLERDSAVRSVRARVTLVSFLWTAMVALRASLSHFLGRAVGWAFPRLLSTSAIHEPAAGLAPLALACTVAQAVAQQRLPAVSTLAILAANLLLPLQTGGAGFWMPLCGVLVGLLFGAAYSVCAFLTSPKAVTRTFDPTKAKSAWSAGVLSLILLPCLAHLIVPTSLSTATTDIAFSHLHLESPTLLTVLLMTAPRPGKPDFLLQSIESWLGAFPDPLADVHAGTLSNSSSADAVGVVPPISSRVRVVVYTHFDEHEMFDLAQAHFEQDSKARHYVEWRRDPRAAAARNRLDQRLHVARGLAYASSLETAYVVLSEDDFPLCEETRIGGWARTWRQLQQALIRTNELMPDAVLGDGSVTPGHCGLFFATGGSGFAVRRTIAARLPALLLGAEDADGTLREAAAERGEVILKREGEDADTPDLVIQDCLRGKLAECADLCAPGVSFAPAGSARRAGGVLGDRYGKSGLAGTERLLQRHLGYNASTLPGRSYGSEEWACGWRQPFNGEPDVLTV
ncbi:hypothetical protein JCM10908_001650 [Rhodotorula pacifica]|uniref:uncharacterized protein n=1 Tax=Rhodotorula pacifica TaxID=1495444 RepID=UPI00317F662E